MKKVKTTPKSIRSYKNLIPDELYGQILDLTKKLKGSRVIFINSTCKGGGVAEILQSEIPLLNDLGINAVWYNIEAEPEFWDVTKSIHNALQGNGRIVITKNMRKVFERFNALNTHDLKRESWDYLYIHDPQPVALPYFLDGEVDNAIWRCHIHVSRVNRQVWEYLKRYLGDYDSCVFSLKEFVPSDIPIKKRFIIPPAIDPLTPKNIKMDKMKARRVLDKMNIDTRRPIISQVSRFDPWKDPVGVIKAFEVAKQKLPDIQLVMAGSLASDDPEGERIYKELKAFSAKAKDIKILKGLSEEQVNALQTVSNVVVQKSIKEGFGLTVAEAMYKETPVIGGNVGGIKLQIIDGKNGFLVDNYMQCGKRMVDLLEDTQLRLGMGRMGKEVASKYFLLPRLIRDELLLFNKFSYSKENLVKSNILF